MAITRQDFENGNEFHFEFQEYEWEQIYSYNPLKTDYGIGTIEIFCPNNIDPEGEPLDVISIHTNYAILQYQKFDRKYTYKLHFQNCNPI